MDMPYVFKELTRHNIEEAAKNVPSDCKMQVTLKNTIKCKCPELDTSVKDSLSDINNKILQESKNKDIIKLTALFLVLAVILVLGYLILKFIENR